jgi:RNA polymerase sigma-70 factor (ECF subfamily)
MGCAGARLDGTQKDFALYTEARINEASLQYHLAHSARAELCRPLGRIPEARASYEEALTLAPQASDRRFLARRLAELK